MIIYFDNCVYQDLKKDENEALLSLIQLHREHIIFCFSEAHLYDLSRDDTDHKFEDMKFMEEIAMNNCFCYDDGVDFKYLTPTDYYNSFDWTTSNVELFDEKNEFTANIQSLLTATPFPNKGLIDTQHLPADMPAELNTLLTQPANLWEFMQLLNSFYNAVVGEKNKFKELIRYLHTNVLGQIYETIGIEGFDGENIINKDKMKNSYMNYFIRKDKKKTDYELFIDMYNGLELLGIVKGRPKKQKLMNLLNDSRHAFFGASCDIIVSKDSDFLKKTKFMYNLMNINTLVVDMVDLEDIINKFNIDSQLSIVDMIEELGKINLENNIVEPNKTGYRNVNYIDLDKTYYSYFNILYYVTTGNGYRFHFTKKTCNLRNGILMKEVEHVIDKLITELGNDINEQGLFSTNEIVDKEWQGRTWNVEGTILELNYFDENLYIAIFPESYITNYLAENRILS